MSFDPVKFLNDYDIQVNNKGKNCSPGWVNINCPFCGDTSNHLGFNLSKGYVSCWKCGSKSLVKVVSNLARVDYRQAREIIKKYTFKGNKGHFSEGLDKGKYLISTSKKQTILPPNSAQFLPIHIKYLESRGFDPDKLQKEFNLYGTGPYGDYRFRIIAPIIVDGVLVSYQGRDVTGQSELRYMACNELEEEIKHKHTLYNLDSVRDDKVIIVEGVTDVWRIGEGCTCTFGTGYTKKQVIEIASRFNQVFILYDNEDGAQLKAEQLGIDLSGLNLKVEVITKAFKKDPAEMKELEAKYLRKQLIGY